MPPYHPYNARGPWSLFPHELVRRERAKILCMPVQLCGTERHAQPRGRGLRLNRGQGEPLRIGYGSQAFSGAESLGKAGLAAKGGQSKHRQEAMQAYVAWDIALINQMATEDDHRLWVMTD